VETATATKSEDPQMIVAEPQKTAMVVEGHMTTAVQAVGGVMNATLEADQEDMTTEEEVVTRTHLMVVVNKETAETLAHLAVVMTTAVRVTNILRKSKSESFFI